MLDLDELLIFIRELGRLINDYYSAPERIKPAILEEISLLGTAIDTSPKLTSFG